MRRWRRIGYNRIGCWDNLIRSENGRGEVCGFRACRSRIAKPVNDLRQQIFLGSEAFVTRMQAEVSQEQPLDEIPRIQRRAIAKPLTGYRLEHEGDARRGMALAYLIGDYTMKAIAAEFGVHYTTVSRAIKEYESKESR